MRNTRNTFHRGLAAACTLSWPTAHAEWPPRNWLLPVLRSLLCNDSAPTIATALRQTTEHTHTHSRYEKNAYIIIDFRFMTRVYVCNLYIIYYRLLALMRARLSPATFDTRSGTQTRSLLIYRMAIAWRTHVCNCQRTAVAVPLRYERNWEKIGF